MTAKKYKLTVICKAFPPLVIGSTVLLSNLLKEYTGSVTAIAGWVYGAKESEGFLPPCSTSYIRMPIPFLQRVYDHLNRQLLPFNRYIIKKYLKKHKPDIVLTICPGGGFFVASCLACKDLGIPFMVHMHDLWSDNLPANTKNRLFADKWEEILLHDAATVFAMTDVQKEYLDLKYNINCTLLPHTIPSTKLLTPISFEKSKTDQTGKTIVYSGNVSDAMNLDAIRQFVKAVDYLPDNYIIKMFISWDEKICKDKQIYSSRIHYGWLPMDQVFEEVKQANAVFLPLSFKNAAMEEVRTVFATKTLDYLVSGVPIIVFSPANSFHSKSATANGWGYVIDQDDPEFLSLSIQKLVNDAELSSALVLSALKEAKMRSAAKFAHELEMQVINNLKR